MHILAIHNSNLKNMAPKTASINGEDFEITERSDFKNGCEFIVKFVGNHHKNAVAKISVPFSDGTRITADLKYNPTTKY